MEIETITRWKKILFKLIIHTSLLLLYPILYLITFIEYLPSNFLKRRDNKLYFGRLGGVGQIKCNVCDYNENIISFIHGGHSIFWSVTGFQCQKCGKFHKIEDGTNTSKVEKCECGGNLDREKPLFCPKCKTNDISYKLNLIT